VVSRGMSVGRGRGRRSLPGPWGGGVCGAGWWGVGSGKRVLTGGWLVGIIGRIGLPVQKGSGWRMGFGCWFVVGPCYAISEESWSDAAGKG